MSGDPCPISVSLESGLSDYDFRFDDDITTMIFNESLYSHPINPVEELILPRIEFQQEDAKLEIINQPQPLRHFRYLSEFKSGSLSSEKKVPVTVKVNKYVDGCFVRCSLVDFKSQVNHPYCLAEKRKGKIILHDQTYYEVQVDPTSKTAKLQNVEIIVIKDKNKHAQSIIKKEKRDGNENTPELLEQINKNLKNIDLNWVALCFQAFHKIDKKNVPITKKIYSNAIKNSHNSSTAKLEIEETRVFKNNDYDEVWIILKKKIKKDKLQIQFYKENSKLDWKVQKKILHQAVIIICIPPECQNNVEEKIKIVLYRTSDEESASVDYTPQWSHDGFQFVNTSLFTTNNIGTSESEMETDGCDENDLFNFSYEKSLIKALVLNQFEEAKFIITIMVDHGFIHHGDSHRNIKEKILHLAIVKNQPKIVKKLLDIGADPNMVDENENTALHLAIEASAHDCIHELLNNKNKINFEIANEYGYMPLHLAIKKNSLKIVKILVEAGAQINAINRSNEKTCLEMAQQNKNLSILKYLQHKGKEDLSVSMENDARDMTPVGPYLGSKYSEVFDILKTNVDMPMNCWKSLLSPENNQEKAIDQKDHGKFLSKQLIFFFHGPTCILIMTFILIISYIFCNYLS